MIGTRLSRRVVAIRARHGQGKRHDTAQEAVIRAAARTQGRDDTMRDTASQACDTVDAGPATRRCARCLGAVRATCAHRLGQGVHLVHPTQFWTQ